ncbi:hypothetical protein DPMN_171306 [Dreissena polymorpha]|uniref:Uncharacterized protein n=1 Tax=Dreissena polymorpha TaxID=45954 RepID=A0A9D4E1G1_DREPO|nr:hypothetical protein DPMN_171306 [Dreissena polymorpha]
MVSSSLWPEHNKCRTMGGSVSNTPSLQVGSKTSRLPRLLQMDSSRGQPCGGQ